MSDSWEDALRAPLLTVACDGSAIRNPNGPGGWAWYHSPGVWAAGGSPKASNNAMELTALLELLQATEHLGARRPMRVVLDSTYVRDCVTTWAVGWERNGWRTKAGSPVKNQELIRPILARLRARPGVRLAWVRGHAGHGLNESADTRARAASEAFRDGRAPATGPGWTLP